MAPKQVIRIRRTIYEIAGLAALLSQVMRRLCVVRSEGVPAACVQNRVTCKKANPYQAVPFAAERHARYTTS